MLDRISYQSAAAQHALMCSFLHTQCLLLTRICMLLPLILTRVHAAKQQKDFQVMHGGMLQELIIGSVILPLLQQVSVLHSNSIGHHHLSPWHVFSPSQQARSLTCTLPCPAAHPTDVNKLLATAVPAEYFAPEVWVRAMQTDYW